MYILVEKYSHNNNHQELYDDLKIILIKQIIIMYSCFVGYLLIVVTCCCFKYLNFLEQTECFENFGALFDVLCSCLIERT